MIREAIKKLSDEKIDQTVRDWGEEVITFLYDQEASYSLGKFTDVLVTSDKKFMHIKKPLKANKLSKLKTVELGTNLIRVED